MKTFDYSTNDHSVQRAPQPWQEPAIAFERSLMAEAQDGIGPRNAPSGILGPLATSGSTTTSTCL